MRSSRHVYKCAPVERLVHRAVDFPLSTIQTVPCGILIPAEGLPDSLNLRYVRHQFRSRRSLVELTEVLLLAVDARAQWQECLFHERDFVPFRYGRACRGWRGRQRRCRFARAAAIAHGFG